MKIIHDKGFDEQQRQTFRQLVISNVTTGLATVLQQMEYLDIKYEKSNIMPQALNFLNIDEGDNRNVFTKNVTLLSLQMLCSMIMVA